MPTLPCSHASWLAVPQRRRLCLCPSVPTHPLPLLCPATLWEAFPGSALQRQLGQGLDPAASGTFLPPHTTFFPSRVVLDWLRGCLPFSLLPEGCPRPYWKKVPSGAGWCTETCGTQSVLDPHNVPPGGGSPDHCHGPFTSQGWSSKHHSCAFLRLMGAEMPATGRCTPDSVLVSENRKHTQHGFACIHWVLRLFLLSEMSRCRDKIVSNRESEVNHGFPLGRTPPRWAPEGSVLSSSPLS